MRSLCRSHSKDGGSKASDTIVAEVVFDNAHNVGIGNANRAPKNGGAKKL